MPLSRYCSGDYVLPAMETAWSLGAAYTVIGAQGARTIPNGVPFGGPGAHAQRQALVTQMPDRMRSLGVGIHRVGWNELDDSAPYFARVDPRSTQSMQGDAMRNLDADPGWLDRWRGVRPRRSHLAHALVLLPHDFGEIARHEGVAVGSLRRAQSELAEVVWSPESDAAVADWREAIGHATKRRLPLIVDV